MTAYLLDPTLMQADEELAKARTTLVAASKLDGNSDKIRDQVNALARLIAAARIEIPVTIMSDERTEVIAYKIGVLGKLNSTELHRNGSNLTYLCGLD